MIICANCGQVNETAASRCLRCGASRFEYPSYLGTAGGVSAKAGPVTGSTSLPPKPTPPPYGQAPPPGPSPPPPYQYATPYSHTHWPLPPAGLPAAPSAQWPGVVGGFVCPYCRTTLPPRITYRTSPAGWVILVLLLLLCWPLFWVGFFFQEERLQCRHCGRRLT